MFKVIVAGGKRSPEPDVIAAYLDLLLSKKDNVEIVIYGPKDFAIKVSNWARDARRSDSTWSRAGQSNWRIHQEELISRNDALVAFADDSGFVVRHLVERARRNNLKVRSISGKAGA